MRDASVTGGLGFQGFEGLGFAIFIGILGFSVRAVD